MTQDLSTRFLNNLQMLASGAKMTLPGTIKKTNDRLSSAALYATAGTYKALNIPAGSYIIGTFANVKKAFKATSTAVITLTDGTTNLIGSTVSLATTGVTYGDVQAFVDTPDGVQVALNVDQTSAEADAELEVVVIYINPDTNIGSFGV